MEHSQDKKKKQIQKAEAIFIILWVFISFLVLPFFSLHLVKLVAIILNKFCNHFWETSFQLILLSNLPQNITFRAVLLVDAAYSILGLLIGLECIYTFKNRSSDEKNI